ncbi:MAG: DUF3307 domain-containing protein [Chloroflexi bacterium]|nr:DUF3307 domain-containing protein [Chloroflexota bacterium]
MLWIIFAHIMGDYVLQGPWIARNKARLWYVMLAHGAIWTGCICVTLQYLGILAWYKIPFLLFGHVIMDTLKHQNGRGNSEVWIRLDRTWHLLQCLAVSLL